MTTPAWYIETCVKAPLPVMSPTAHTPSVTRQRSSTGAVRESLATPTVSSPTAAGSARRPVATSSFSAVTRGAAGQGHGERRPVVGDLLGADAPPHRDAVGLEGLLQRGGRLRLLEREDAVGGLDDRHVDAEAGHDLAQLTADGATAEHDERGGQLRGLDDLVVGPVGRVAQALDRRHRSRRAGVDDDARGRGVGGAVDIDRAPARRCGPCRARTSPLCR